MTDPDRACRLGVLLSGRGSNFAAIQQAIREGRLTDAILAVVLSNRADAPGLHLAHAAELPAFALSAEQAKDPIRRDAALLDALQRHEVDFVVLAGYDRIVGST